MQGWGKAGITLHLETPLTSHNPGGHTGCAWQASSPHAPSSELYEQNLTWSP